MGPAGAGKSVQGKLIADKFGLKWLSVGNILRNSGDESVMKIMKQGLLIDDELVEKYLEEELDKHTTPENLILDGFPRNLHQAEWLKDYASSRGVKAMKIVQINIDSDTRNNRLTKRGRLDDNASAISERQKEYQKITMPLIENLKQGGFTLIEIDGAGTIEDVNDKITTALKLTK